MPRWAAFLGLTGVVLALFLALARLSQSVVDDGHGAEAEATTRVREHRFDEAVLPEFVPPQEAHTDGTPARETPPWEVPGAETPTPELTTGTLLANLVLTQGLFGGLLVGGVLYFDIPADAVGVGTLPTATAVAVGAGLGLCLWLVNELAGTLADVAGAAHDESLRGLLAPTTTRGWVLLFGVALPLVAVAEEFIFRAVAIGAPAAGFGVPAWLLVVLSSAAFALAHGAQGRVGILVTGGLGAALAAGFVLTGSLLVVVVAHYLVNALEFGVHELLGVDRLRP